MARESDDQVDLGRNQIRLADGTVIDFDQSLVGEWGEGNAAEAAQRISQRTITPLRLVTDVKSKPHNVINPL